jgi:hypothetical protein
MWQFFTLNVNATPQTALTDSRAITIGNGLTTMDLYSDTLNAVTSVTTSTVSATYSYISYFYSMGYFTSGITDSGILSVAGDTTLGGSTFTINTPTQIDNSVGYHSEPHFFGDTITVNNSILGCSGNTEYYYCSSFQDEYNCELNNNHNLNCLWNETSYCSGSPYYSCTNYYNEYDCEYNNAHGGCTWTTGTDYCSGSLSSCYGLDVANVCGVITGCYVVDPDYCAGSFSCSGLSETLCDGFYGNYCTWDSGMSACNHDSYPACSDIASDSTTCNQMASDGTGCYWYDYGSSYCDGSISNTNCDQIGYDYCQQQYTNYYCSWYDASDSCDGTSSCSALDSNYCSYESGCSWSSSGQCDGFNTCNGQTEEGCEYEYDCTFSYDTANIYLNTINNHLGLVIYYKKILVESILIFETISIVACNDFVIV